MGLAITSIAGCSNMFSSSAMNTQSINMDFVQITDSAGLVYIGAYAESATVAPYLTQLKRYQPTMFEQLRQGQHKRDHGKFHLTLINPYEYQDLTKQQQAQLTQLKNIPVTLHGLGGVTKGEQAAYYIVASSADAQSIRRSVGLKDKDFHITLGFSPNDIYDKRKNSATLIK